MKSSAITFLTILVIALALVITCPDKNSHAEALEGLLSDVMKEAVKEAEQEIEENPFIIFGAALANKAGEAIIANTLRVDNYFIFSRGRVTMDGETYYVSFGILNHVFVPDKDDVLEKLKSL